jgi:hypothetical protein
VASAYRSAHGELPEPASRPYGGTVTSQEFEGMTFTIDPSTLRDSVDDPVALARWCAANPEDPRTVSHLRVLGRLEEAEALGRALLVPDGLHPVSRAMRRARWAHVLQWQGRFETADEEFSRAAEETGLSDDPTAPSSILALATVLQHRAKNRFEHALVAEAAERPRLATRLRTAAGEDAGRALAIREALSAPRDQILSSRETVARLAQEPGTA